MFGHRYWGARFFGAKYWGPKLAAVVTTAVEGGGVRWPPQWWLQQTEPPLGTQPAIAHGTEFELYAELDPGDATGKAKATARRMTRKAVLDAGEGLGFAVAGDASAVVIAAKVIGSHVVVAAEISAGRVSAAGMASGEAFVLSAKLIARVAHGHAVSLGADDIRPSHFIAGHACGGFAFDFAELDNDLLMIAA